MSICSVLDLPYATVIGVDGRAPPAEEDGNSIGTWPGGFSIKSWRVAVGEPISLITGMPGWPLSMKPYRSASGERSGLRKYSFRSARRDVGGPREREMQDSRAIDVIGKITP